MPRRGGPGRRRRLSPDVFEVQFTDAQSQGLRAMFAATGQSRSALVREAVEALLITNGFLEASPTNEGSTTQP